MAEITEAVLSADGERRLINEYSQVPPEEISTLGHVSLFTHSTWGDNG